MCMQTIREGKDGLWGGEEEQRVCRGCGCYDRALVGKVCGVGSGRDRSGKALYVCTSVHVYIFIKVHPSLADMPRGTRCVVSLPRCVCSASQALDEARGDVDAAIEKVIEYLSNQIAEEGDTGVAGGEVEEGDPGSAVQAAGEEVKEAGGPFSLEGGEQAMEAPVQPREPIAAVMAGTEGPAKAEPSERAGAKGEEAEEVAQSSIPASSAPAGPEEEEAGTTGAREEAGTSRTPEEDGTEGIGALEGSASAPAHAPVPDAPALDASHAPLAADCPAAPATSSPLAATSKLRPVKTKKAVRVVMADKKPPNR